MAASSLDIVNSALARIGASLIDAGELATPTKPEGQLAQLFYAPTRDEELRLNPWAFALVRATLTAYVIPAGTLTLSSAAVGTGVTATASTATFLSTDIGKTLRQVTGGAGSSLITGYTSATVVTVTTTVLWSSVGAHASGAWRVYQATPANTWAYTIAKPTEDPDDTSGALLRLVHVRHQVPHRAEGDHFVSDSETLDVVYIQRVVDTTLFDPDYEEALISRLAIKFAYGLPGKLELVKAMGELYGAVISRAKQTSAIEGGEGKFEADPEDVTVSVILQDAIGRLGRFPAPSGDDPIDPTGLANGFYPGARDELIRLWPPRFSRTRVRLDATTTTTLTPAAVTGDAILFTAGVATFVAADVGLRILADNGGVARIVGFTSTTEVTADIEEDFPDLVAIAAGDWHLAPPWNWAYRYALPTDYLRLTETQNPTAWNAAPVTWGWPNTWTLGGQPYQEPAVREGAYLVSDVGPTLDIEYGARVTDPTLFDSSFRSVLAALIAWRLALPVTGKPQIVQLMQAAFMQEFKAVRGVDKLDTARPPRFSNSLLSVRS